MHQTGALAKLVSTYLHPGEVSAYLLAALHHADAPHWCSLIVSECLLTNAPDWCASVVPMHQLGAAGCCLFTTHPI
jgi:hypothetical protein